MDSSQMPIARGREIASTRYRHHPDGPPPKLNDIAKEDVRQQTAKPMQSIPRSGMADLQYASCLDNSNHPEADRALPSIWTLFCCQSAQKIVRYQEMNARFVAEEVEEDEFRRSKGVTEIEALRE